jgi:hypothetical protein
MLDRRRPAHLVPSETPEEERPVFDFRQASRKESGP